MQNATNLRLCKNCCYQPLKPSSFLWHEKCVSHPGWTQSPPLPITTGLCSLPRQRTFNPRHKYATIFTVILLKAVKWPLKAAHFCSFQEYTPPTPPLPERPSPLQNFLQKQQKQSRAKTPPSKPFVSVSAKLRAARVRTCTRDTFSRSFMFDPEGNQLLQVRRAELPIDHISDGSVQAEFLR